MNTILKTLVAAAATVPVLLAPAALAALPRHGVTFGAALGGGTLSCSADGCEDLNGAGSLDVHVGGMLGPRLALLGEVWWMVHTENRLTIDQGFITGALRFWPVSHFWLQAGVGAAQNGYSYDADFATFEDHSEWVPGFVLALGVELVATPTLGFEVGLRYGTGFYSDGDYRVHSAALTLGVSFY